MAESGGASISEVSGAPILSWSGYTFKQNTRSNKKDSPRVYWICAQPNCKGTAVTIGLEAHTVKNCRSNATHICREPGYDPNIVPPKKPRPTPKKTPAKPNADDSLGLSHFGTPTGDSSMAENEYSQDLLDSGLLEEAGIEVEGMEVELDGTSYEVESGLPDDLLNLQKQVEAHSNSQLQMEQTSQAMMQQQSMQQPQQQQQQQSILQQALKKSIQGQQVQSGQAIQTPHSIAVSQLQPTQTSQTSQLVTISQGQAASPIHTQSMNQLKQRMAGSPVQLSQGSSQPAISQSQQKVNNNPPHSSPQLSAALAQQLQQSVTQAQQVSQAQQAATQVQHISAQPQQVTQPQPLLTPEQLKLSQDALRARQLAQKTNLLPLMSHVQNSPQMTVGQAISRKSESGIGLTQHQIINSLISKAHQQQTGQQSQHSQQSVHQSSQGAQNPAAKTTVVKEQLQQFIKQGHPTSQPQQQSQTLIPQNQPQSTQIKSNIINQNQLQTSQAKSGFGAQSQLQVSQSGFAQQQQQQVAQQQQVLVVSQQSQQQQIILQSPIAMAQRQASTVQPVYVTQGGRIVQSSPARYAQPQQLQVQQRSPAVQGIQPRPIQQQTLQPRPTVAQASRAGTQVVRMQGQNYILHTQPQQTASPSLTQTQTTSQAQTSQQYMAVQNPALAGQKVVQTTIAQQLGANIQTQPTSLTTLLTGQQSAETSQAQQFITNNATSQSQPLSPDNPILKKTPIKYTKKKKVPTATLR